VKVKLMNSDGRLLQDFLPLVEGQVGMYCCGPTVYNYAHIGNMRAYTFEDILRRTLEYAGYKVNHVMNVTDVGHLTGDGDDGEDKMIKSAREQGMTVWDIAQHFTDAFFKDSERLNIKRPLQVCKATDHIQDMIDMIKTLEDKGFTYVADGNVYFNTANFPEYGRMANLENQDLQHGARVAVDENKKKLYRLCTLVYKQQV
jgi:cysteinyl-tRNA synthetase